MRSLLLGRDTITLTRRLLVGGACVVFALTLLIVLQYAYRASAQVAHFYPSTCLGSWHNVAKAAGSPDVTDGDVKKYNDSNSAVASDTQSEIFCGSFSGEMPEDALQKKVVVAFSWSTRKAQEAAATASSNAAAVRGSIAATSTASTSPDEVASSTTTDAVLDTASTTEATSTSVAAVVVVASSTEGTASTTPPTQTASTSTPVASSTPPAAEQTPVATSTSPAPESSPVVTPEPVAEPTPASAPETLPAPPPAEPTMLQSLLHMFVGVAHAQEATSSLATSTASSSLSFGDAVLQVSTSTASSTLSTGASSTLSQSRAPEGTLLEVLYTLDGTVWQSLGYVSSITNDVRFDLPHDAVPTRADLQHVQIAVRVVGNLSEVSKVYLDSLSLEVEYERPQAGESAGSKMLAEVKEAIKDAAMKEAVKDPKLAVPASVALLVDKTSFTPQEDIRIVGASAHSAVAVYWLNNPDTAPQPSNVYAAMVNDDGTLSLSAATLFPGTFALISTSEPGNCGGLSLEQCKAEEHFHSQATITILP